MKKIILLCICAFALVAGDLSSQTEKGTLLLGGNASFESQDGDTYLSINPNIGLFLSDNLAAGLSATLGTSSGFTSYGILPFIRPYFGSGTSGKFFAQASAGIIGFSSDFFGSSSDFAWSASLGYAIFLNQSVALELGPTYSKIGDRPGTISLGVGFQIHFQK